MWRTYIRREVSRTSHLGVVGRITCWCSMRSSLVRFENVSISSIKDLSHSCMFLHAPQVVQQLWGLGFWKEAQEATLDLLPYKPRPSNRSSKVVGTQSHDKIEIHVYCVVMPESLAATAKPSVESFAGYVTVALRRCSYNLTATRPVLVERTAELRLCCVIPNYYGALTTFNFGAPLRLV